MTEIPPSDDSDSQLTDAQTPTGNGLVECISCGEPTDPSSELCQVCGEPLLDEDDDL
jgi:predicted amidophosphoribosyltransferase